MYRPFLSRSMVVTDPGKRIMIWYMVEREDEISVTIYDIQKQLVAVLFNGKKEAGSHCEEWNISEEFYTGMKKGVFFYNIQNSVSNEKGVIVL